jgi:hypothetical protein
MGISTLRQKIESAAASFAKNFATQITQDVFESLHAMSLDEISALGVKKVDIDGGKAAPALAKRAAQKSGRLERRSDEDIATVVAQIEVLLKSHKDGLRAEEIRAELGLQAKEMPRPIAMGLSQKRFKKTGHKRSTVYTVAGGGGAKKPAPKKAAKKASAKPAKKTASAKSGKSGKSAKKVAKKAAPKAKTAPKKVAKKAKATKKSAAAKPAAAAPKAPESSANGVATAQE